MERIQKAMEKLQAGKAAPRIEPSIHADTGQKGPSSASDSDTAIFRTPALPVDQALFERNRILLPGATGAMGRPYKMLRTQVLQRMAQIGANTLAVLSPTNGAGKTLTAINLAIAVSAEEGRTALLIDFDLRNPSIHKYLGLSPELGIEDCIEGQYAIRQAMMKLAGYDRLTVLPARRSVEASSELLSDQRTADLVAELRGRYPNRTLIFDMPPVLQADDALAFTRNVQAGLIVVREGHTQREDVQRSIELLRDLTIVGTVLNASRDPQAGGY
jgi:Mrp family chromosome partitioning ATPase